MSAMTALTTANQLTLFRLLAVPCVVILVLYGFNGWALVTFVTAGVTDALDWEPRVSLAEGLRATIDYFRSALATAGVR